MLLGPAPRALVAPSPHPLHVLPLPAVCNVGTNTQLPTLQYTEEDYRRIMGTNLDATYALVASFQPLLAAAGSSSCILVSSVAGGPLAGRSGSLYAASKAALNQLAKSWACEWAGAGVRVNAVAPWVTLTELGQQVGGLGSRVGCCLQVSCAMSLPACTSSASVACCEFSQEERQGSLPCWAQQGSPLRAAAAARC